MKLSKLVIALGFTTLLVACGGKGSTEGTDGSAEAPVDAASVTTAKDDALAAEKDNHEMRKEIFELKGKLGISTEEEESE